VKSAFFTPKALNIKVQSGKYQTFRQAASFVSPFQAENKTQFLVTREAENKGIK